MSSLSMVHFVAPEISRAQLEAIARTLDIEANADTETLKDRCFERSYQVCKRGQWDLIDPIVKELSLLTDKVGRSLLLRALMEQNDAVVSGLTGRAVGLTTMDLKGNPILMYLAWNAAGVSTKRYTDIVIEKLRALYSAQSINYFLQVKATFDVRNKAGLSLLNDFITGKVAPEESVDKLKNITRIQREQFGYFHSGNLNYLRVMETLQRNLGKTAEADQTKEEYRRWFSFLFGFEPAPLEKYSKQEILAKAQSGEDQDVDRFVKSCPTRFLVTPNEIPEIGATLTALAQVYGYERKDKTIPIIETIFLLPDIVQEMMASLCVDMYREAAGMLLQNAATLQKAQAFYDKAIAICDKAFGKDHPLRLHCESDRVGLKLFVGNLKGAEADYRRIVEVAEKTTDLPHPFFLCEVYSHLASILYKQEEYEESLKYAKKAYELCQRTGADKNTKAIDTYISSIGNITKNLICLKRFDEALPYAQQTVHLWEAKDKSKKDLATALVDLGNVFDGKEVPDKEKAHTNFIRAFDIAEEGWQTKAIAAGALGRSYLGSSSYNDAANWSKKASELFAGLQSVLPHDHWKITIFEQQVEAYREWERALILGKKFDEALVVSDLRRSRALAYALSKRVFPGTEASLGLTLPEMISVAKAHATTFVIYSLVNDDVGLCWVISPRRNVDVIQIKVKNIFPNGLEELLSETSNESRGNREALPFASLYEKLNRLALAARTNSEAIRGDSDDDDEEWEAMLKKANTVVAEEESKIREQLHIQLKLWYKELIEPIEACLPQSSEETVTFIPDGPMAMLPFAIFEKSDGSYFVEKHASLVSPSIRVAHLLGELKNKRSQVEPSGKSVVVCNPDSKKVNKLTTGDKEGKEVSAVLHTPQERLMLGSSATVNKAIPLMRDAQWIHVTSHGNANVTEPDNPNALYKGHLYFTPDKDHSEGVLYAEEISKVELQAEFVFLSACYSGRGNTEYIHEGLVGFARALASVGVLTTASSYWQLPDTDQTVSMIKTFYQHVLGKEGHPKLGKAIALQRSMMEFVNKEGENNPNKWSREDPHKWGALFLTGIN